LQGELDHLACRYYRIEPRRGIRSLRVSQVRESPMVKVQAAVIDEQMQQDQVAAAAPIGVLEKLHEIEVNHLVVVVSNCGIDPTSDGQQYLLEVQAE